MTPIDLALLLGLATLWGGSYFFIRIAVPVFGPAALVALRVVIGGVLLWLVARATRRSIDLRPHLPRLAVLGLLNAALPYVLISAAELHLTASFAAILGATVPLFAAALGARLLGERLSAALRSVDLNVLTQSWVSTTRPIDSSRYAPLAAQLTQNLPRPRTDRWLASWQAPRSHTVSHVRHLVRVLLVLGLEPGFPKIDAQGPVHDDR